MSGTQENNEDWIAWSGNAYGDTPPATGAVEVRLRPGYTAIRDAASLNWYRHLDASQDIVAYRIHKESANG